MMTLMRRRRQEEEEENDDEDEKDDGGVEGGWNLIWENFQLRRGTLFLINLPVA